MINRVIHLLLLSNSSVTQTSAPGPPIPSPQTAFGFPPGALPPTAHNGATHAGPGYPLPPLPPAGPRMLPPPPGPPPPPLLPPAAPSQLAGHSESSRAETKPVRDARSDLLSAIRMGELEDLQNQKHCFLLKCNEIISALLCMAQWITGVQYLMLLKYSCVFIRHPAEESPRAAGAAEQAGAGRE